MATYTELVDKIINWSNRDVSVFGADEEAQYNQLKDFINYAADSAYRKLRVVPLEATRKYTLDDTYKDQNMLNIPVDAIEFIQLTRVDENGTQYPYSSKLDIISFREVVEQLDGYGTRKPGSSVQREDPNLRFWTRHQNQIMVYPPFVGDEVFELYYYRRLPAPNARFSIASQNNAGLDDIIVPATWSAGAEYEIGNVVSFPTDNAIGYNYFIATAEITPYTQWDPGVANAIGDNVSFNGLGYTNIVATDALDEWDSTQLIYNSGAQVAFENVAYIALRTVVGFNNPNPAENTEDWAVDTSFDPDVLTDSWDRDNSQEPDILEASWDVVSDTEAEVYNYETDYFYYNPVSETAVMALLDTSEPGAAVADQSIAPGFISSTDGGLPIGYYIGKLTYQWLRDENEKVLLFGALEETFDYLEEPEQSQKYMTKFMNEIEELNMEDTKRIPSGGTISINYGSNLL